MKRSFFFAGVVLLCSCNNEQQPGRGSQKALEAAGKITTGQADTVCFLRTTGDKNQDSDFVHLVIVNDRVAGELDIVPYEKDARRGTFRGSKLGNDISGVWTYLQEGQTDSIRVMFRLEKDRLLQKAASVDPVSGREILRDTAAYSIFYKKTNCNKR